MAVIKDKETPEEKQELSGAKQVWANIKLIWANRQYRSAIKLFLYLIFMATVLIMINMNTSQNINNQVNIKTPLELFGDLDNYQYQTIINKNNELTVLDGNYFNSENNFTVNNIDYKYKDNQIYLKLTNEVLTTESVLFNVFNLTPTTLQRMINKSEEVSKTNYKNGMIEINYELSVKDFSKIYAGQNINNDEVIAITTRLENNNINRVSLNMINYLKIIDPTINTYLIEINYLDIKE